MRQSHNGLVIVGSKPGEGTPPCITGAFTAAHTSSIAIAPSHASPAHYCIHHQQLAAVCCHRGCCACALRCRTAKTDSPTDFTALWRMQLFVVVLVAVFYLYPAWADVGLSTFACFVLDASYGPITPDQKVIPALLFGFVIYDNDMCTAAVGLNLCLQSPRGAGFWALGHVSVLRCISACRHTPPNTPDTHTHTYTHIHTHTGGLPLWLLDWQHESG